LVFCSFDFLDFFNDTETRSPWIYLLLGAIAFTNLSPFFETQKLLNARYFMHPVLKPLLASRALHGGVKISVEGNINDPICRNLKIFIKSIGHLSEQDNDECDYKINKYPNTVNVIIIDSVESRDKWFANMDEEKIMAQSVVVYSGDDNPFTNDEKGKRLMKYLVLVKKWEGMNLASSIFSGISVRVVSMLYQGIKAERKKERTERRKLIKKESEIINVVKENGRERVEES